MRKGTITQKPNPSVDVQYELWLKDADNAGGRITIKDDPVPGATCASRGV